MRRDAEEQQRATHAALRETIRQIGTGQLDVSEALRECSPVVLRRSSS